EGARFTCRDTRDRLVDAVDEVAGTHLVGQPGRRRLLDLLAVHFGRQVDGHEIPVGNGAINPGQCTETRTQRVELLVHFRLVQLRVIHSHRDALVVGQRDLRTNI